MKIHTIKITAEAYDKDVLISKCRSLLTQLEGDENPIVPTDADGWASLELDSRDGVNEDDLDESGGL